MIFEGSRYRGGFMYKTLAMSAIVSFFIFSFLIYCWQLLFVTEAEHPAISTSQLKEIWDGEKALITGKSSDLSAGFIGLMVQSKA